MDIFCPRCGEPWDAWGARNFMDMSPREYGRMIGGEGCPCCFGKPAPEPVPDNALKTQAAISVLGDDVDGIAAMCEDL